MNSLRSLLLILACLVPAIARSGPNDEAALGEPVERHLSDDQTFTRWAQDPAVLDSERGDRLEVRQVSGEKLETVKLRNVVPPIRFESGVALIPPEYVATLNEVLEGMRQRRNLRVHFVGHADAQPLSPALVRVFEDNAGLSRERAGEVAEYFKTVLDLPPEAISYEWAGDTQPIASNASPEGRTQNRRVEVEVWYDEASVAMRDEEVVVAEDIRRIKVCRMETVCKMRYLEGHARRARVRNLIVPLRYDDETAALPETFTAQVRQALDNLRDRQRRDGPIHRPHGQRSADRTQRAHLRRSPFAVAVTSAPRRPRHPGVDQPAGHSGAERRPRHVAADRIERDRAGSRAESAR